MVLSARTSRDGLWPLGELERNQATLVTLSDEPRGAGLRGGVLMGWVVFVVVIVFVAAAAWTGVTNMNTNNERLGGSPLTIHRAIGLNYLGGHPRHPSPIKTCNLVASADQIAIEKGAELPFRLPIGQVEGIQVETEQEAKRRLTATRMLAVGVFALAIPKKTPGSVLVTVETNEGPLVFEMSKTSKAAALSKLSSVMAQINSVSADRPKEDPPALQQPSVSVADELAKLVALRDAGEMTPDEFQAQKARLFSDPT